MNIDAFRTMFPAFAEYTTYSDDALEMWSNAAKFHLGKSWLLNSDKYDYALMLMTAHLCHISGNSGSSSSSSNGSGIVASASEGSVSVSFATPTTKNGWEFWLASSPYGLQLWALLQQMGSGGCYIGGLPERLAVRKVGGVYV